MQLFTTIKITETITAVKPSDFRPPVVSYNDL